MNPVLILTRNCLDLTKRCVESVRKQDIPAHIYIYDNGSTDKTCGWLEAETGKDFGWSGSPVNDGVSIGWNIGLDYLFDHLKAEHVLVLNNDVILPAYAYSEFIGYSVPFVSGTETREVFQIGPLYDYERKPLTYGPDFSCFLIRRECWKRIGNFDIAMKIWCSDCDYDVRARKLGMPLWKSSTLYYHERASTSRLASQAERRELARIGDADRAAFKTKWGCLPGTLEYEELFK